MFVGGVAVLGVELIYALLVAADVKGNILVDYIVHFAFGFIKTLVEIDLVVFAGEAAEVAFVIGFQVCQIPGFELI